MKDLEYYLNLPYEIIVRKLSTKEGGGYFARYKDFPYIMGDGQNESEAIKDAKEAFKTAIALMLEKNDYIKEPNNDEAKVRINITMSKSLIEAIDKITTNRSKFLSDLVARALN
ncbi:HicB family protein [Campylobacter sp. MIT 99-7217]|uniref:type II toxin-antitoxin system HicB family antitoxin n=1 Tax=Campylobacter sp. MIT 99-7217 TaxID=535091 RepID=UPI001157F0B4|nr:type II toxin-antitoxin system HicB family antitoxin [Campylobacter sp. MIT 99-7217]TQR31802.1 HicB family protein [Campylobacter sp. MIT 99-7217]